ncbi:uncharacterized protein LOC105167565 [Sesamum indicum]|uniref:Uncharacterized protein LOC105167565 n=1 Tax=Sesamum indicum TaxID=4182 RepID=A0A6I9TQ79_SESIN|nr:uncharacterized protein LOC105167565 [Sesamum indicum]
MNTVKDGEWQNRTRDRNFNRSREMREGESQPARHDKKREPPYQPKYHNYTPLAMTRTKALMMVEKSNVLKWPRHTRYTPAKKFSNKYCRFHREKRHDTEGCFQLKDEIERLVRQGYFRDRILSEHKPGRDDSRRSRSRSRDRHANSMREDRTAAARENASIKGVIHIIAGGPSGGDSKRMRKRYERVSGSNWSRKFVMNVKEKEEISFSSKDRQQGIGSQNDPMLIRMHIANFAVHKVLIDNGSSADIIFKGVVKRMGLENTKLEPVKTLLVSFGGTEVTSLGTIRYQFL